MTMTDSAQRLHHRRAPIDMPADTFRALGYQVIDRLAAFLDTLPERPVTRDISLTDARSLVTRGNARLPRDGRDEEGLLTDAIDLLVEHSLFNGHPRFWGYITSSPAPIGALGDVIAAVMNPNEGAWTLSPIATEIERQTIEWIAEMIGYPTDCAGLLSSGGNMGNFLGLLVARRAKAPWDIRAEGLRSPDGKQLLVYASTETHTWIQKAADQFGFGTNAIRWIGTDADQRMDVGELERQIQADRHEGGHPFVVVGTAGSVSTGVIDPLGEIARICRDHDLWFHIDGAYGGMAALLPDAPADLKAISHADSIALDPHKWLYSPLEAGCTLVRNRELMRETFSFSPPYYNFGQDLEDPPLNYADYGLQNSRGFRALKVWLALQQVGIAGYQVMIADDIALAEALHQRVDIHPELEAVTHRLSITTFRYVPSDLLGRDDQVEHYLNELNRAILGRLQGSGEAYVSNAVIRGMFVLRACVVNFRTTLADIEALPEIVVRMGKGLDAEMRPAQFAG